MTVQTLTSVPFNSSAQTDTHDGLTQTEAKSCSLASLHNVKI